MRAFLLFALAYFHPINVPSEAADFTAGPESAHAASTMIVEPVVIGIRKKAASSNLIEPSIVGIRQKVGAGDQRIARSSTGELVREEPRQASSVAQTDEFSLHVDAEMVDLKSKGAPLRALLAALAGVEHFQLLSHSQLSKNVFINYHGPLTALIPQLLSEKNFTMQMKDGAFVLEIYGHDDPQQPELLASNEEASREARASTKRRSTAAVRLGFH
jgi:hypothetical protein